MKYEKPYLYIDQQIELLQQRGLIISDLKQAKHYLSNIGYYRLSGYFHVFKEIEANPDFTYRVLDNFKPEVDFKDVLNIYIFDKKLKLLLMDAIERIEIALRVNISLTIGKYYKYPFEKDLFKEKFFKLKKSRDISKYTECKNKYEKYFKKSSEEFVDHFKRKYQDEEMPVWIAVELWDYGILSNYLSGLKDIYLKEICKKYKTNNFPAFLSWVHMINVIRNVSAHHGRVWNRSLPVTLKSSEELDKISNLSPDEFAAKKIFAAICAIKYLLAEISPNSSWIGRVKSLIKQFPESKYINISNMGFPDSWENLDLFKLPNK
jgi:abortive infection bacteriophage resistance protein